MVRIAEVLRSLGRLLGEVYLVGGAVRDIVLGLEPQDLDFATPLPPEEVARRFSGKGLPVDFSGAQWGTVGTFLQVGEQVWKVEVTTFRREISYEGRRPVVSWAKTLGEDLARRDFTINAMAYSLREGIVDPFGGREDLERGVVRAVGKPRERFSEDPLRVVRALRFAARHGWTIDARTLGGMRETAHLVLERVSTPRLGVEIEKGLMAPGAGEFLRGLHELGLFYQIFPEFTGPHGPAHTLLQNPLHHPEGDVLTHAFQVVERARALGADPLGMWASLLHDVGKPATATPTPEGWYRFPRHEEVGAEMVEGIARRFGFSRAWEEAVRTAVRLHMRPLQPPTPRAVRRFQAEAGEHLGLLEV
ncbi:CCA tRNA nucleotidyltransferase, partial [Fervidobacterium sp.]